MKYFILSNSTDEKEIGNDYPQCKGVPKGYSFKWYDNPNSMTELSNDFFPKNTPNLIFELKETAILTDVVSPNNINARGFLVNQKVKNILCNYKLLNHQFYNADVIVKNKIYKYYWVHFVKKDLTGINFKKSYFIEADLFDDKVKNVTVNSLENYITCKNNRDSKFNRIIIESLKLNEDILPLDLFFFPMIHSNMIVSQKLLNKIKECNIKGLKYKEASFIQ